MATLINDIQITGSLGNLSYYKIRGSDKIVVRRKGDPSGKRVKEAPEFERTRENNREFGGRSTAAKYIKSSLHALNVIADYNFTGPLNALLRLVQVTDTVSDRGERNVLISKNPRLLEGVQLNRRNQLESIVRAPLSYSLQDQQVVIDLPELIPGINFITPASYPFYRFIALTAMIPDFYYTRERGKYQAQFGSYNTINRSTDWLPVTSRTNASKLIIDGFPANKPDNASILIALGISFGAINGAEIEPVNYVGAARIIGMI
ncbi:MULTISPECIES: hypothetical protein [Niastella]|uniref:Uncharacterized protein n=1 Tax=Niastella soli TaxID=2821487 RepID=A0ABS3Z510_9BACT|nr:hypothetical protein [Niastella soli]MBO9205244.1 hypothetical protein [Niastella soli]